MVDLKQLAYKNKPFITTEQAKQMFYIQDPYDERWLMVLHGKTIGVNLEDDDSTLDTCCRNLPFGGRATRGSWVHLPREENAWSRHQRLFKENVGKTGKGVVYEL